MPSKGHGARFKRRRTANRLAGLAAATAFIAEANAPAQALELKVNVPQPKIHITQPSVVVRSVPSSVGTKLGNSSSKVLNPSLSAAMQKGLAGKLNNATNPNSSFANGSKTGPVTFSAIPSGQYNIPQAGGGSAVTVNVLIGPGHGITTSSIANAQTTLQNDLDSDNEVSEMGSMRLQMLMDTRTKLLNTASDIEKSKSSTEQAIVGNIKQ